MEGSLFYNFLVLNHVLEIKLKINRRVKVAICRSTFYMDSYPDPDLLGLIITYLKPKIDQNMKCVINA